MFPSITSANYSALKYGYSVNHLVYSRMWWDKCCSKVLCFLSTKWTHNNFINSLICCSVAFSFIRKWISSIAQYSMPVASFLIDKKWPTSHYQLAIIRAPWILIKLKISACRVAGCSSHIVPTRIVKTFIQWVFRNL